MLKLPYYEVVVRTWVVPGCGEGAASPGLAAIHFGCRRQGPSDHFGKLLANKAGRVDCSNRGHGIGTRRWRMAHGSPEQSSFLGQSLFPSLPYSPPLPPPSPWSKILSVDPPSSWTWLAGNNDKSSVHSTGSLYPSTRYGRLCTGLDCIGWSSSKYIAVVCCGLLLLGHASGRASHCSFPLLHSSSCRRPFYPPSSHY